MTRMIGPDCAVMCNLINTHTHTHGELLVLFSAADSAGSWQTTSRLGASTAKQFQAE